MSLDKLKELTSNLPDLSDLVKNKPPGHVEYLLEDGVCLGFALYKDEGVSVQRAFMSKGSTIPEHTHEVKEIGIVYTGELTVIYQGEEKTMVSGDVMVFEHMEPHVVTALVDTWMIFLTIPPDKGYPDVTE